jgi:excinuclease ABC subunit C
MSSESLSGIIKLLPESPGIYQYYDAKGRLLYVGKAINLKKRVSSYFNRNDLDPKTSLLVSHIANVSTIVTPSETEALLLEDSLIKKHKPPYNIDLKDDKRFPYFCLTLSEKEPRLLIVRQRKNDGNKYFGPYAGSIQDVLRIIKQIFPIRKCNYPELTGIKRPCMYFQIKQCLAPCVYPVAEAYRQEVDRLMKFLQGDYEFVVDSLTKEMNAYAASLQYEKAAEIRDKLKTLERIASRQSVIAPDQITRDIWSFAEDENIVVIVVLIMQNGRITGSKRFFASKGKAVDDTWFERTIESYYQQEARPQEVILPQQYKTGFRANLVAIARKNALQFLQEKILTGLKDNSAERGMLRLQEVLNLETPPVRLDCFDISHIQGAETVASMTVFRNGKPDKKEYRKYIINLETPNDFAAMQEVLSRRYLKVATGEQEAPSLVIIDGGKGQLQIAVRVLETLHLSLPLVSIAKRQEELYIPGRRNPIVLKRNDPALKIIQQIRDEAHRFAIEFHRLRRSKRTLYGSADAKRPKQK